tara:strand:- start:2223 stop:2792 length:570 start_codon:yes stop_codon:yes gene_type:complete
MGVASSIAAVPAYTVDIDASWQRFDLPSSAGSTEEERLPISISGAPSQSEGTLQLDRSKPRLHFVFAERTYKVVFHERQLLVKSCGGYEIVSRRGRPQRLTVGPGGACAASLLAYGRARSRILHVFAGELEGVDGATGRLNDLVGVYDEVQGVLAVRKEAIHGKQVELSLQRAVLAWLLLHRLRLTRVS